MDFKDFSQDVLENFNQYMYDLIQPCQNEVEEAMLYSLEAGGKRIRPLLILATVKAFDKDVAAAYGAAAAIEWIHTYSLIHDDLPSMDNDDLRRGKPSCHKAYDEATAILAGDGLLTKAFEVALDSNTTSDIKVKLIKALASYSGIDGMIYGQDRDLKAEKEKNPTLDQLIEIDEYKTAKLLTLPMVCAALLSHQEQDIPYLEKIGYYSGIQFQMQDDILDITQSADVLGKSTSDKDNGKLTIVSLLGLEKSKNMVKEYDGYLREALTHLHCDTVEIEKIFDFLLNRTY